MSTETTLTASLARAAEADWHTHIKICGQCRNAKERRRPALRCPIGADLALAAYRARQEHARQKAEDARPAPGQEALFSRSEVGG